jgi:hypothetical protein
MRNLNIIFLVSLFFLSSCTENSCPASPQNESGTHTNLNYWGCDGCYSSYDIVFYTTEIPYPEAFGSDTWEETIYCNEINWFQFEGYLNYRTVSDPNVFQTFYTGASASGVYWEE